MTKEERHKYKELTKALPKMLKVLFGKLNAAFSVRLKQVFQST